MLFEKVYSSWFNYHLAKRRGERLRRLKEGHGHAEQYFVEKLWWPAFQQLDCLHPEYEVIDYKGGTRFIDFAYIQERYKLAIEILGYGSHFKNASRKKAADDQRRARHLTIDGWIVITFTYDELVEYPRTCQQELQQLLGRLGGYLKEETQLTSKEKDILRLAVYLARPVTRQDIVKSLGLGRHTINTALNRLLSNGLIHPHSGSVRIRSFAITIDARQLLLGHHFFCCTQINSMPIVVLYAKS